MKTRHKWTFLYLFLIAIIISGCVNNEYKKNLESGIGLLEEGKYEEAITYFEEAFKVKETQEIENYLFQTKNFVSGLQSFEAGELDKSDKYFNDIINQDNEIDIITEKAEHKLQIIKEMKRSYTNLEKSYNDAAELGEEGKYQDALTLLGQSDLENIDNPYMKSLLEKVETLEKELKNEQGKLMKTYQIAEDAYKEAQRLEENNEYKSGLNKIEDTLKLDLNHIELADLKGNLNELKSKLQK